MLKRPIYLDNHATTAVDPQVVAAMLPYFTEKFGNTESAQHSYGWEASLGVDQARMQVANLIGAQPREIIFTSGATESIALSILGLLENESPGRHIISCVTEHKATLQTLERAQKLGHEVTLLKVNHEGKIDLAEFERSIKENTSLVSLMHANNEIGTIHPIEEVSRICRAHKITLHVDAAQTAGKHDINAAKLGADLLSLSAHKFHGPKGVGALYVSRHIHLASLYGGGGQEHGIRGGTLNVPGIVGLGQACQIAQATQVEERKRLSSERERLIAGIEKIVGDVNALGRNVKFQVNGARGDERLCNNVNVTLYGVDADRILLDMKDVAFSSASACAGSGKSHVLDAIGVEQNDLFDVTMRFGLGRFTTDAEVDLVVERLTVAIGNAAKISNT